MNVDDPSQLATIGHDFVQSFVAVSVETFLIAIYAVMVLKAVTLLRVKSRNRTTMMNLAAVILLYFLSLVLWIIDCVNTVAEARITLISDPGGPLVIKYGRALDFIFHRASIQAMLYSYMSLLGDAVIIWRVYAFSSSRSEKWLVLIPCMMFLGSVVTSLLLTFCVAHLGSEIVLGTFQKPAFCRNIQTATYATTLATTLTATLLIAIKTWRYRRLKQALFSHSNTLTTRLEKIMIMLVESGMLYGMFFLAQLLFSVSSLNKSIEEHSGSRFALTIFDDITSVIVGMYPTLIIILVHSNRALLDDTPHSVSGLASLSTPRPTVNVTVSHDVPLQDFGYSYKSPD